MSTDVDPDRELVEMAQGGHRHAFAELVSRHKGRVFSTASRFARNHHELDDLAQDIFIKAWRGLDKFRGSSPFEHWLMRLAIRACYDFLRRQRWRREHEVSREALLESGYHAEGECPPPDPTESDDVLRLRAALARLKPKERLVITLLEIEERSLREIAELTGWSEGNVKVRAFRARQSLRKLLTTPPAFSLPGPDKNPPPQPTRRPTAKS